MSHSFGWFPLQPRPPSYRGDGSVLMTGAVEVLPQGRATCGGHHSTYLKCRQHLMSPRGRSHLCCALPTPAPPVPRRCRPALRCALPFLLKLFPSSASSTVVPPCAALCCHLSDRESVVGLLPEA